jgi:hypothetical protein
MARKPKQLSLELRTYSVRGENFEIDDLQARDAPQAKYRAFKLAREAGYFKNGFRDFLERLPIAVELQR